ncbi:MAG: FtsB family cell division protein [Bacillota bacterium]
MKKKIVIITLLIVVAIISYNYYRNYQQINNLESKIENLNSEIEKTKEENEQLNKQLVNIENNEFVEKIARTKLGLVKPGEVLLIPVEEENKNEDK